MTELERMVWVDLETMGLDPSTCPIMEVGFRITDLELNTIDDFEMIVWETPYFDTAWDQAVDFVRNMHTASGLLPQCRAQGMGIADAHERLMDWLKGHNIQKTEPLCGSSVQFDRLMLEEQYPEVHDLFNYRNIDISTLKELCRRFNPDVYSQLDQVTNQAKAHRALSDLTDTINEFRFYRDEFLIW